MLAPAAALAQDTLSAETSAAIASIRAGDTAGGLSQLEALARGGDASAAEAMGELITHGVAGIARDPRRACDYFEQGAAAGRGDSAHSLAGCFYYGNGRPRDYARAAELYEQAVAREFPMSRCALGNMYVHGQGVPADPARGYAMCLQSAEAGDIDAMTDVAEHQLRGALGQPDFAVAHLWLTRAAEGGQRNAPYWLGLLYWNGDGVEKSNAEAARWWRMAFERGRVDAARLLGDEAAARFADAAQSGGEWRAPAEEAKRWYEITLAQDSSPENQAHARNMLEVLRQVMQRGAPG